MYHSTRNGHLSYFQSVVVVNNVAMNNLISLLGHLLPVFLLTTYLSVYHEVAQKVASTLVDSDNCFLKES